MYAMLLMQMFTGKDYQSMTNSEKCCENDLSNLQEISPELKCIIYECLHAQDKTLQREEDRYDFEISRQINRELNMQNGGTDADFLEQEAFKDMMQIEANKAEKEEQKMNRLVQRKRPNPMANAKNYEQENARMGVTHEVDLILQEIDKSKAKAQYDKGMVGFSQDLGAVKKAKEQRYLTVQGLLNHPYFIMINEADISIVIDEFEKLQSQGDYE